MTSDQPLDLDAIQARAETARRMWWHGTDTAGTIAARRLIGTDVAALIAEVQRARQAETNFHATLDADGFVAITQAEHDEYQRLQAGEWQWGVRWGDDVTWKASEDSARWTVRHDGQDRRPLGLTLVRRWVGPVETVQEQP